MMGLNQIYLNASFDKKNRGEGAQPTNQYWGELR